MRLKALFAVVLVAGGVGAYLLTKGSGSTASQGSVKSDEPQSGGVIRVSYRSEPPTYNRYVSTDSAGDGIARLAHATLLRLNRATGQLEPRLAREWTSSPDGLTWTFSLRDDVVFSDGTPFTAADVVFSFRAVYDPAVSSSLFSSLLIDGKPLSVRALDAHTVVMVLPAPYGPGLSLLDSMPILPSHKLKASLDAGTFADAWNMSTPLQEIVGLGPFVLSEHVPGQRLVLTRNPRFWQKDSSGRRLPYLDRVEIYFAADQNAEVLRLQSGDLDVTTGPIRFEDLNTLRKLEAQKRVTLHAAGVSIAPDMLWFNLTPAASAARHRPWLQSEALRKAISLAVNRQALVNTVFLGEAVAIAGPITPGHGDWYAPDAVTPVFDRTAAKQALASIGLTDRTGDGRVDDQSGKTARFTILTQRGHTGREKSVEVIADQLRQIGLQVDVDRKDSRSMIDAWSKGEYDAIYFAVESDSKDPARNREFWASSGGMHFWNPRQAKPATTWEARIDDLMTRQASSTDRDERRRLFVEAQQALAEHMPVLYFAAPNVLLATSERLRGVMPSVLAPHILWNAETLSVTGPPVK